MGRGGVAFIGGAAAVYLEVSESDVPVSGRVSVGAGHEQGVIFV